MAEADDRSTSNSQPAAEAWRLERQPIAVADGAAQMPVNQHFMD
jgi:hypothetical protein